MSGPITPHNHFQQPGIPAFSLHSPEAEHIWLHSESQTGVKHVLDFGLLFWLVGWF